MTNIIKNPEFKLFVTHVDADGPLLKIFGQIDQETSIRVEKMMEQLIQPFSNGVGKPSRQQRLDNDLICCGMFEGAWFRAQICSSLDDGSYAVRFIDYGNTEILDSENIRIIDAIPEASQLIKIPPQSFEYILAGVLPRNSIWDGKITETILQFLQYKEYPAKMINVVKKYQLITLLFSANQELTTFLIGEKIAVPATTDEMFRAYTYYQQPQPLPPKSTMQQFQESHLRKPMMMHPEQLQQQQQQQHQLHMHPPNPMMQMQAMRENVPHMLSRYPPPLLQSPRYQGNPNAERAWRAHHPSSLPMPSLRQPKSPIQLDPPQTQDASVFTFKSQTIEVDTKYHVIVSYVENGPSFFSVQLQRTANELASMMHSINSETPQPLVDPPLIGTVCLGRYSGDKRLLRAVIGKITEHCCRLHYVDYGHGEILPFTEIYQIPPKYTLPPAMAIRFTLYRVNELGPITEEIKKYFTDLVRGKTLLLHIIKPNDLSLIHYCDLYDNGRNILNLLRAVVPNEVTPWQQCCKLDEGAQEIVLVTYVESCNKFYVQLDREVPILEHLMIYIANYAKNAPPVKVNQLRTRQHCIALSNFSLQWSRAEIVNIAVDKVTVFFVDYGNQETIPLESIRYIIDPAVTHLRAQAIRCILKGYETICSTAEVDNHLEALILEQRIPMIVKNVILAGPIVELFDPTVKPLQNILVTLQQAMSNGNVQMKNNNETSQNTGNISAQSDDQGNKWNATRGSRPPRIQETNTPVATTNIRSNNVKEDDNEQKRYDNRYQNRGNDRERTIGIASGQQNDRFSRDEVKNDRYPRDGPRQERQNDKNDRYERPNESNANNRGGGRGGRNERGYGSGRFSGNNSRSERNGSAEKSWSDKDSDTSSKGSGRHGRRDSGGRGGHTRREGGTPRTLNNSDADKNFKPRSNGSSRIRDARRDFADKTETKQVESSENKTSSTTVRIPPPNITVGAVKFCDLVFMNSPTDFQIQLSPDNVELEAVMANIEATYQNDGKILSRSMIKPGTYCVAQYSDDNHWYRATIQTIEANGANVYFVDYGNSETVPFEKIKEIDAFSAKLAAQAIACKLLAASKTTWDPSEIAKFGELADSKILEAEFVALDNKVYDILLREVDDGVPKTKYINEEFSAGTDLNIAKNTARNKGRQNNGRTEINESTDYVPLDYKWNVETLNPGSKHNVAVTWFINPDNFFCQSLTHKDEFDIMMNDMQELYAKRPPINEPLQVGSAVIAVFSDDGAMYRAEILELNQARGNIVHYVDFGNRAMVEARNIYRVDKKFTKMPKQAIQCSLKNIVPANSSSWSKANRQEIDKYFDKDNYECTFHEIKDNKYIISLCNGGIDVAGQLVDKSLAAFAVSGPVASDNNAAVETTNKPQIEESPRFDISLLAGQILRVKVSNVASIAKFHVQLPSATVSDNIIDTYMADKDPKVMPRLSFREVCLGAGCLVNTDEGWRRAVVVNCSRTTFDFDVRLIDTGANDKIPLDCMLALPGELAVMQNQAVECCLKSSNSSLDMDEKFRDQIENKNMIIVVDEVDNNRLIVDLYDTEGNKIKISPDEPDATICTVCPMPILHSTHQVIVVHVNNSGSIWLKRSADMDTDALLLSDLFDYYDTNTKTDESLLPGVLCAAKSADGNWYRAKILSKSITDVTVQFLDYGNTEDMSLESIRPLEPKFHIQSQLAIEVALTVTLGGTKEQQQEIINAQTLDKEFTATIYNVRKNWVAELTDNEGKISEKLSTINVIEVSKNREVQAEEMTEMIVGGRYKVICSHVDSPAQFWLQRDEETPLIEQQLEKLQIDSPGYLDLKGVPELNTLCVAMYSADEQWYRAEVLDADEDITTIRFIDYGNTDVIDTNTGKIKQIPDTFVKTKRYATKCRLDVIPVDADDWTQSACEYFEQIVLSMDNVEALVIADSNPRRVELFVNGESVVDDIVKNNHATKINTEEDLIEEIVDREIDPRAAYISHVISPSEFWVQPEQYVRDLEILEDRFIVADMFEKIDYIKEGLLCVAKFPNDGLWYRAIVISHGETGTEVFYIDYGNSAVSTEIRKIPDDLANLPQLSKKCCLALPNYVERWSVEAEVEFVKIAAGGVTVFLLDVIENGDEISIVRLTQDGHDIVERLSELCEHPLPVIEERLPPLGEENSPNVIVSHVNSPSDFWTQPESGMTELHAMGDNLIAAESFLPLETIEEGSICAAKFPEDDSWYRAKVLSHGDTGTDVLYIDYGNSAVTTELRRLPEDIVNIPALSMCCSLKMPENIEAWSEEACEKFFEIVNDGTMFQYEILEKREQTLIKLTIEGKDIVDILSPLCAKKIIQQLDDSVQIIEVKKIIDIEKPTIQCVEKIVEIILDDVTECEQQEIDSNPIILTENEKNSEEKTNSSNTSGIELLTYSETTISSLSTNLESTEASSVVFSETETMSHNEVTVATENTPSTIEMVENPLMNNEIDVSQPEIANVDNIEDTVKENGLEVSGHESNSSIVELSNCNSNDNRHEISVPENGSFRIESSTPEISVIETNQQLNRSKTPVMDKMLPGTISRGLSEEEIIVEKTERCNSVPNDEKIVTECINDGDNIAIETSEEIVKAHLIEASEEPETAQKTKTSDEPEIAQEIKTLDEPETTDEIKASEEAKNAHEIKNLDEPEVAQEIITSYEPEITHEIKTSEETTTTQETKDSDEPETTNKIETSDELETTNKIKASDEPETAQITKALDEPETSHEPLVKTETPREIKPLVETETAPKISKDESDDSKSAEMILSSEQNKKIQIEDKILPGSRVETPFENFPTTPKTPHSEKLVANVVNLQEKLTDLEADETLTVVIDENIPK